MRLVFARAASTGDAEVPCTEVWLWPSSVSNLSAHLPCEAMHRRTSPRPVSTDELGRCDAEHGAGQQRVGAALASHGRGQTWMPGELESLGGPAWRSWLCRRNSSTDQAAVPFASSVGLVWGRRLGRCSICLGGGR